MKCLSNSIRLDQAERTDAQAWSRGAAQRNMTERSFSNN
ncbi:hypothetical protein KYC_16797 [Achromobacter arsenitoxydans SY8]|uniref:Uncharacterized protein n=1 Tax=Achromobacter arsenitoxydans SY8 TaxID=477184 RepID=H0F9A7_9BURK|nr:hypothetical protein KYC_16797 [Achromobacter arsenitoxydans SY8]